MNVSSRRIEILCSFKKLVTGGELSESIFTGPGEVLLAPETWGDIVPISLDGQTTWSFGKDAFLAATRDVMRTSKSQGLGKALCESLWMLAARSIPHDVFLVSGEGLFVYQATGRGIVFVQSLGAIVQRQLGPGEQWIGTYFLLLWNRVCPDASSQSTTVILLLGLPNTPLSASTLADSSLHRTPMKVLSAGSPVLVSFTSRLVTRRP